MLSHLSLRSLSVSLISSPIHLYPFVSLYLLSLTSLATSLLLSLSLCTPSLPALQSFPLGVSAESVFLSAVVS